MILNLGNIGHFPNMSEFLESNSCEKISAFEQVIFDVRFAINLLMNSLRVNAFGIDIKDLESKLCKIEEYELRASRKVNAVLRQVGVNFAVEGVENIPSGPVIFLARHESWWDTVGLQAILYEHVRREHLAKYLAKKELFEIPLLGKAMYHAGHIPFDRARRGSNSQGDIRFVLEQLKRDVIVFVEGTRKQRGILANPDERAYHRAMVLARLKVPLVPVFVSSHSLGREDFSTSPKPHLDRRICENTEVQVRFGRPLTSAEIKNGALERFIHEGVEQFELYPGEKVRYE